MPKTFSDCSRGSLNDYEPTGTIEAIAGIQAYVARPSDVDLVKEPLGVIIILPDMFGWSLVNTRKLADIYAQRTPAVVVVPDLFKGRAVPARLLKSMDRYYNRSKNPIKSIFSSISWNLQLSFYYVPLFFATLPHFYNRKLLKLLRTLRTVPLSPSGTASLPARLAVAGFCHGGKTAVLLSHGTAWAPVRKEGILEAVVDCVFTAHPSMTKRKDWQKVVVPLSLANGDDDMMMGRKEIERVKGVLETKEGCEVRVYEGAMHGFGIRACPGREDQARLMEGAREQAVGFFQKHLKGPERLGL